MTADEYAAALSKAGFFAFPTKVAMPGGGTLECGGLTKRDWYAGLAMQAILKNYMVDSHQLCAANAFDMADAMLAASAQEPKP